MNEPKPYRPIYLTPVEAKLLCFLRNSIRENGIPPTTRELATMMRLPPNSGTIRWLITKLVDKGYVKRESKKSRALQLVLGFDWGTNMIEQEFEVPVPCTVRVTADSPDEAMSIVQAALQKLVDEESATRRLTKLEFTVDTVHSVKGRGTIVETIMTQGLSMAGRTISIEKAGNWLVTSVEGRARWINDPDEQVRVGLVIRPVDTQDATQITKSATFRIVQS